MKKHNLENKLKTYSALATGVIAIGVNADAQVIYTDVNPDITQTTIGSYQLNLNNDTAVDFHIDRLTYVSGSNNIDHVIVDGANSNELLTNMQPISSSSSYILAKALNTNNLIDSNETIWESFGFMNAQGIYSGNPVNLGNWQGVTDKYLGLRFKIAGQWHYGWARLDVDATATSFTIKDYAYESTPNKKILAGQTVATINENNLIDNISIYSNNKTLFVDLKDNNINDGTIKMYNMAGQEIKTCEINNANMQINVEDLANGIYVVNIYNNQSIVSKKININ